MSTWFMNSNSDFLGAFQGQRLGVTPQPILTTVHSFLQLVLLWCILVMLMSLELEWSSLSDETPRSLESIHQGPFLRKLTGTLCTLITHHVMCVCISYLQWWYFPELHWDRTELCTASNSYFQSPQCITTGTHTAV